MPRVLKKMRSGCPKKSFDGKVINGRNSSNNINNNITKEQFVMDKDKIVKAFDDFVGEKYADSEETLRTELRQAVNDFLKNKLELEADPIQSVKEPEPEDNENDNSGDKGEKDEE